MSLFSFILPSSGTSDEITRTLASLIPFRDKIQLVSLESLPEPSDFPHIEVLSGAKPSNLSHLINLCLPHLQGEFVAVLSPGVEIASDFIDLISSHSDKIEHADFLYGDYYQENESGDRKPTESNPCPDDITEREDWGPLEMYRVAALHRIGGCDLKVRYRTDYDLRLKLTQAKPAFHIPEFLCTAPYRKVDRDSTTDRLFFPGRGKFGGFSYLFMKPEEERETEEIFYHALRSRTAFLGRATGSLFPVPAGNSPRVSVIIPVHNRAEFLPLAVSSVQKGTFEDFEIIIIDNASQDDTLAVARDLVKGDSRLNIISLPDNVIAKALNAGVNAARGDYIAQLDSDDEYASETLGVMVQKLDENLAWALAISYYYPMDESGEILDEFGVIKHLEYNRNNILRVDGAGALRVWRRAAIEEMGGFNEEDFGHYGEDYDLVLKVGEKYEVGRVHQVLYHYRRHPGNSDILRPHSMKIKNKTLARQRAIGRRQLINQKLQDE